MSATDSPIHGFNDDLETVSSISSNAKTRSGRPLAVPVPGVNPLAKTSAKGKGKGSVAASKESLAWDNMQNDPSYMAQGASRDNLLIPADDSRWSTSTHRVSIPSRSNAGESVEHFGSEDILEDEHLSGTGSPADTVRPRGGSADHSSSHSPVNLKREITLMIASVEEDITPFRECRVSASSLTRLMTQAQSLKILLREKAVIFEETNDEKELIHQAAKARRELVEFLVRAEAKLSELQQSGPVAQVAKPTLRNSDRERIVKASFERAHEEASELIDVYIGIADCARGGEDGVRRAAEQLAISEETYNDLMESFRNLNSVALDQGQEDIIESAEEDKAYVRQFKKEAKEAISVNKRVYGLNDYGSRRIGLGDLKPPEFSGDQSKPLDYFSFRNEWEDYVKLKGLTVSESIKVLTRTSLSGPAKEATYGLDTLEEMWSTLRDIFGNPRRLIDQKIREMSALGEMPKKVVLDQRDWVIKTMAKLKSLHSLCRTHGLLDELYHGQVVESLLDKLPYDFRREFKKEKIYSRAGDTFRVTRQEYFCFLMEYIQEKSRELTIEVNMDSVQPRSEKPASSTRQDPPTYTGRKKTYLTVEQEPDVPAEVPKPVKKKSTKQEQVTVIADPKALADCPLCGSRHSHLYYCPKFIDSTPDQRFKLIRECRSCAKCLRLGVNYQHNRRFEWWKTHKDQCCSDFVCEEDTCKTRNETKRFHMLVCSYHVKENKNREKAFIQALDINQLPAGVSLGSLSFFYMFFYQAPKLAPMKDPAGGIVIEDVLDNSLFLLQTIVVKGEKLLVFFDSGCGGAAISDHAYSVLDTETVREGPTTVDVAGGKVLTLPHGDERFLLDLLEPGNRATITALRMPEVTSVFPQVDLRPAFADLKESASKQSRSVKLPEVGLTVGGRPVDIVLGARYFKYFPVLVHSMATGLGIYRTCLKGIDGVTGILGGPHKSWNSRQCTSQYMNPRAYFTGIAQAWSSDQRSQEECQEVVSCWPEGEPWSDDIDDPGLEGVVHERRHCHDHVPESEWTFPLSWDLSSTPYQQYIVSAFPMAQVQRSPVTTLSNRLWECDEVMTKVMYRCPACRNCNECKKGDHLEAVSFKEEREQIVIEQSVVFLPDQSKVVAWLPFMFDPEKYLSLNRVVAEKVLNSQLKKFSKYPQLREDALRAHEKMVSRGHVKLECDLTPAEQELLKATPGLGTFIPWRTVQKNDSLSTPCRIVFDASAATVTGRSLNNILAKGENRLVLLHHMLIRFRLHTHALTADISMCYNGTKLRPEHYKWQQYLWKEALDPASPTVVMFITTIIYGVVSSGGQSKASIERLADYYLENVNKDSVGAQVLKEDTYVDDIATSWPSMSDVEDVKREVTEILALGSMQIKGYTVSGQLPDEAVSADGKYVLVCGYRWQPAEDLLYLNVNLPTLESSPSTDLGSGLFGLPFTRRTVTGLAARIFDPLGLATPVISQIKRSVHAICLGGVQWDDPLPRELLAVWQGHVQTIQSLGDVAFNRAIIPRDAAAAELELVVSSDASESVAVAAVHARVLLKDGSYHTQLVAAKSKVVRGLTVPRAELKAAVMGAILSAVVRKNFGACCGGAIHVTDSAICMFWLHQDERPLQVAVRNAVIEILRFSSRSQWFHIDSGDNVADLGTREAGVSDIQLGSEWQLGKPWMKLAHADMPIRSAKQLVLNGEEKRVAATELRAPDIAGHQIQFLTGKVAERYAASDYVIDPCRFNWEKTTRVLALAIKFTQSSAARKGISLATCPPSVPDGSVKIYLRGDGSTVNLGRSQVDLARQYFFRKAAQEVKGFQPSLLKQDDFVERDGIIYYTGRVIDGQGVLDVARVMFDLGPLSFVRPVIDRYSPIAYSIMVHIHWSQIHHLSSVATLRKSREFVYVLKGRDLADEIVSSCVFCKRFKKRLVQVEFGKLHQSRLTIAPPFYLCQVDLFGPFTAFCEHNHRSTVKVWGVVFKDPASLAIWVAAMPAYTTEAFVMAYNRFAARFSHPAKLYIDGGSQLVKACKEMKISTQDIVGQLGGDYGVAVEFEVCSVGGHNEHGIVERSIQEVKKLFHTVYDGIRLSVLGLETAFAYVANELNNLPIGLGSRYAGLDDLDLITPARLIFGRASTRAMSGYCQVEKPTKLLEAMEAVFQAWWKVWAEQRLIDWVPQPAKWKRTNETVKVGDVVMFPKVGAEQVVGRAVWRLGRVVVADASKRDGRVRKVEIEYKNLEEGVFRRTVRAVREVAVLHRESDLEVYEQLNQAAREADRKFHLCCSRLEQMDQCEL